MKSIKMTLLAGMFLLACQTFAQTTTIWVVRHAEKATTAGNDPDLSTEGKTRAAELAKQLKDQKIAAVFTTPYKRTTQTGEPTLKQFGLTKMQNYETANLTGFANQILTEYAGREILVIGHSNTIIPTLKAFGLITNSSDVMDDEDYDQLYKLTIGPDKKAKLVITRYGEPHHSNKAKPQNTMMMQAN